MARTTKRTPKGKATKKATTKTSNDNRQARGRVITYRISDAEFDLIQRAADREPVARFSRRVILAAAGKK